MYIIYYTQPPLCSEIMSVPIYNLHEISVQFFCLIAFHLFLFVYTPLCPLRVIGFLPRVHDHDIIMHAKNSNDTFA